MSLAGCRRGVFGAYCVIVTFLHTVSLDAVLRVFTHFQLYHLNLTAEEKEKNPSHIRKLYSS